MIDVYDYLQQNFKLITREEYRKYNLSNNTKKILCDIGLPNKPLDFIQFNIDETKNIILDEEHIIIGNDFGTYICINNKDEIISVDPQNEYPVRFINNNLETFLEFIITFLLYKDKISEASDDEINEIIWQIEKKFNITDIRALSNEENWWPVILEQIELGIM
ncbi:MAG: hypothetical protein HFH68_12015 [Lachnospiraceae bacterium]|nr:hypothetical protein [Lachnospiraceae bacterium]